MRRDDAKGTPTTDEDELAAFLKRHHYSVDRGWSWVILAGSCVTNLVASLIYTVGIFNVVFLDAFQRDRQTTAWLGAVQCSLISLVGLPAGYINNRLGPRITTMLGALCGSLGFLLAYFANSFFFVFVTYGVLVGIGHGLVYLPCIVTIGFYFKRYRNLAFCVATCTVGLGTLLITPILKYSIDTFGWRGCMLITSGIYLQVLVVGAIMRPQRIPDQLVIVDKRRTDPSTVDWTTGSVVSLVSPAHASLCELRPSRLPREKFSDGGVSRSDDELRFYARAEATEPAQSERLWNDGPDHDGGVSRSDDGATEPALSERLWNDGPDRDGGTRREGGQQAAPDKPVHVSNGRPPSRELPRSKTLRPSVFANKRLIILNIHYFFSNSACLIGYIHFPDYFLGKGASHADVTLAMTLIGVCNSTSRLLCGVLANGVENTVLLVYMSASGLTGIVLLLCPLLCTSHAGRLLFAVGFSLYGNVLSALITPVTLELCSMEELSVAYGVELFIGGISGLVGPPFAGWLYDVSGDYMLSFLFAGSMYIFGTLLLMIIPMLNGPTK